MHESGNGTTDEAVKPVVVELLGPDLPLVHGAATALGLHPVLGRKVLSKGPVYLCFPPKERQASFIAHGYGKPGVNKRITTKAVSQQKSFDRSR